MKRKIAILSLVLAICTSSVVFAEGTKTNPIPATNASPPTIESQTGIVMNAKTGEVLFEKDADISLPPASLTKIMTLELASEALQSGKVKETDLVPVSAKAWKTGGSRMFLEVGRKIPYGDIMKGIGIVSGNDASVAIAEFLAGSTDNFVNEMNAKAQELGMKNTHFTTVDGLSPSDSASARDLAILSSYYVTRFPQNLKTIHNQTEFSFDSGRGVIKQQNHDPLLNYYPGADGLKTGWILTNYNIVGTAERNGVRLIGVTLNSKTPGQRARAIKALLDYGFAQYTTFSKGKKGDTVNVNVPVYKTTVKKANLVLADDVNIAVRNGKQADPKVSYTMPKYLVGDMKAGTPVGKEVVTVGDKKYETNVVLQNDLPKANLFVRFFDSIAIFFKYTL